MNAFANWHECQHKDGSSHICHCASPHNFGHIGWCPEGLDQQESQNAN